MKVCPKCGEVNGDNNAACFKCNAPLKMTSYRKICSHCQSIYDAEKTQCDKCGRELSVYSDERSGGGMSGENWPYVVAALFPGIGIILGLIYIAQKRDDGSSVLILSLVANVIWILLALFVFSRF